MKLYDRITPLLRLVHAFPLSWLSLSWKKRLFLAIFSYILGSIGLELFFPPTHDGSSMFLPIVCSCWLFRYRGLLVSLLFNGLIFQLFYVFWLRGILPDQAFVEGGIIGFVASLGLGLVVCWLRTAVDLLYMTRQRAFYSEQERLLAKKAEEMMTQSYERERTLNTLKDQLVLMLNHELRTPLTAVRGYLELLTDYKQRLSPSEVSTFLHKANASCMDLADLLETTFEAAYLTQQIRPPNWEKLRLRDQVLHVIDSFNPYETRSSRFQVQIPPTLFIWSDQQYLRQIVRNLLSNAMKYSPTSTPILIGTSEEEEDQDHISRVTLWIQDFGKGILPEEISLLFGMFVRLHRELNGNIQGLGLGLYISQRLIHTMGGEIEVESTGVNGEGSRFSAIFSSQQSHSSI